MKHIVILVPETAVVESVADPHYMFTAVNQFLAAEGKRPMFRITLAGIRATVPLHNSLFTVRTESRLQETGKADLIIIPAISGDVQEAIRRNRELLPWIVSQYRKGAEVASLCIGAFLFAATGLLEGKKCSTHWNAANEFRSLFPGVELVDGSIITEDQGLYTSGGANSYWNLLLRLVEKYAGRDKAIQASKYFAIDIDRCSQSAFVVFQGQKEHDDPSILEAQEYIEKNYPGRLTVEELASRHAMGRRSFERRFRKATHNSVVEYMQRVKVEVAKRSFESSRKNIHEVMYDVGYTDTKAFRTVFKKVTGLTPIEYRNKYYKQEEAL